MNVRTVKDFLDLLRRKGFLSLLRKGIRGDAAREEINPIEKRFGSVVGAPETTIKRRVIVKKTIVILVAALMVTAAGCKKTEEAAKASAPQVASQAVAPQPTAPLAIEPKPAASKAAPQTAAPHPPIGAPSGGDPHANLRLKEIAAGTGHQGKVLQVMEAGNYTYLEVEEKGQKIWIAALKAKLSKGDIVEFPDSKPMEKFESKTLKRTFDKIIFAESIKVVK
ncbi:MAG: hypothetical protein M1418_01060 [Deltaproteobacteria bacterium]|nr:hypothetical protein [Deltaproteobacteria bacterium]